MRLGLDAVRLARVGQLDIAVISSQDQDLAELVREVNEIARDTDRWIKVASVYPAGPAATSGRGVDGAEWYPMDRAFYDACLDPRAYRPRRPAP